MTMDAAQAAPANDQRKVRVKDVIREAAAEFEMTETALLRRTRQRDFAQKRQVAMYLARELTPCSYPRIGEIFGAPTGARFDHSTVFYAHKIIGERLARNARLAAQVARIRARLGA